MKFTKKSEIKESLERLNRGMAVTVGTFHYKTQSYLDDMEWNHMDQLHRPFIHKTYEEVVRIATGKNFAVSLTRWGRWPIFITVTDVRIDKGLFYQCMTLAGIFYIHFVLEMTQVGDETATVLTWHIASHRFFKILHPILSRKFHKLNVRLQQEDAQIRERRFELRKAGYSFKSDPADYLSANLVSCNTIAPPISSEITVDLSKIVEAKTMIEVGKHEFIILRNEAHEYLIWPGVCPHEGGKLFGGEICGDKISCPWHGLKFSAVRLSAQSPSGSRYGFHFELVGHTLIITASASTLSGNPVCAKAAS